MNGSVKNLVRSESDPRLEFLDKI